jgi:hypothetical protein
MNKTDRTTVFFVLSADEKLTILMAPLGIAAHYVKILIALALFLVARDKFKFIFI